jgi:hypothetical protein
MSPVIEEALCADGESTSEKADALATERKPFGLLITAVITLLAITDALLRLLPPEYFSFRAHEALRAYRESVGPFRVNAQVVCRSTYGDLANLANLPQYREYRSEVASTDSLGNRNLPSLLQAGPAGALMLGDSFAMGTGLNDGETLAVRLSERTGLRFYSMASQEALPSIELILSTIRRIGMKNGLVIFQHLERKDPPAEASLQDGWNVEGGYRAWLRTPFEYSPLQIVFSRLHRKLLDDRWFPNPYSQYVRILHLEDGGPMLFHRDEFEVRRKIRNLDVSYWVALHHRLSVNGHRLLVFSVPDKLTVYHELVLEKDELPPSSAYLHNLTLRLDSAGVPALDLTACFKTEAKLALRNRKQIYWRDDSHWNSSGVQVAADEITRWLHSREVLNNSQKEGASKLLY